MTEFYRVVIRPDALEDAKNYYEYIAGYSPEKAVKWSNGLFEVIDSLTTMPKRCSIAHAIQELITLAQQQQANSAKQQEAIDRLLARN